MIAAAALACALALPASLSMSDVARVESGGNEIAINVNRAFGKPVVPPQHPNDAAGAASIAHRYIALGYTVDIGAAQVNSAHLPDLDLTVEQLLDPCTNIRAGSTILADNYKLAVRQGYSPDQAALVALSYYNTGTPSRGFANGYVAHYAPVAAVSFRPTMTQSGSSGPNRTGRDGMRHNEPSMIPPDPYAADGVVYVGATENAQIN